MPTVFRIYTENVNRKEVLQVVAKKFENFTFQPTTGYFVVSQKNPWSLKS
ncbi:MAG TPA: hypothetical protein VN982_13455 [Candidatus Dormibacteraeota bacterium]|nr:hypothetical protein [Candidatus Dormibacteraeota bacterium]